MLVLPYHVHVSSYLVYTCHQNHIFSYHTQPPQNLIFRTDHSLFQNSGRPAQGGSRPMCTIVHSFELAVDRFTNQSTGRKPGAHAFCPVDRQSTGTLPPFITPVDRHSTGTRPAQPGAHGLFSVDRPLTPVDRWSVLGRKSVFSCRKSQLFRNPY